MPKARAWTETLKSGRTRGVVLLPNGRKVSMTHDYDYEAELWGEQTLARAAAIVAGGDQDGPAAVALTAPRRGPVPTISAYGETWIEARAGFLVDSTVHGYRIHLAAIGTDKIARIRLDEISIGDVEGWVTRQKDAGIGAPTINARLKVLRMLSRYAVKNRIPGAIDATEGVPLLTTEARKGRVVTKVEENRLLLAAHSAEATAQILLGLDGGLRFEEALGLPTDCLVGGVGGEEFVDVRQVLERTRTIRGYTKGKRPRIVPASERVLSALRPLIEKAEAEGRELVFSRIDADAAGNRVERPVDYHNWRRDVWRKVTAKAKVNRRRDAKTSPGSLHFHDLRHTFGSRLAAAGVPRSEIAEVMGHADEDTTKIYIHAGTDGRRRRLVLDALNGVAAAESDDQTREETGEAVRGDLRAG